MRLIDRITSEGQQKFTMATDEGGLITFNLRYLPTQLRWMMDVSFGSFITRGIALTVSGNILRNYKNIIPFGIAITSEDGFDPYYLEDFESSRCQMYLINSVDIETVESLINEI